MPRTPALLLFPMLLGCHSTEDSGGWTPQGDTVLAFLQDGVPTVWDDGTEQPMVAASGDDPILHLRISEDGSLLAFCAKTRSTSYEPFAGPPGQVQAVYPSADNCKQARPLPDGSGLAWIEYGQSDGPSDLIRFTDLEGASLQGDGQTGNSQVWSPWFIPQTFDLVAIWSGNSDEGPLARVERASAQVTTYTQNFAYPVSISSQGLVAGGYGGELRTLDVFSGQAQVPFAFPVSNEECSIPEEPAPYCYWDVDQPTFNPAGDVVAFVGEGDPVHGDNSHGDLFLFDLGSETLTRLNEDEVHDTYPRFSADGAWLYWVRDDDLVRARIDGQSALETLVEGGVGWELEVGWPGRY